MNDHIYNVNLKWSYDRKGVMCSPELDARVGAKGCIEVATPPEFPKGMQGIWSPEHLFTASVSSCLMTTFLAIADNSKLKFISFECLAKGKLESVNGKFLMTEIMLEPKVIIENEVDTDKTMRIIQKTEQMCLISNSIKSTVIVNPKVLVAITN